MDLSLREALRAGSAEEKIIAAYRSNLVNTSCKRDALLLNCPFAKQYVTGNFKVFSSASFERYLAKIFITELSDDWYNFCELTKQRKPHYFNDSFLMRSIDELASKNSHPQWTKIMNQRSRQEQTVRKLYSKVYADFLRFKKTDKEIAERAKKLASRLYVLICLFTRYYINYYPGPNWHSFEDALTPKTYLNAYLFHKII